MRSLIHKVFLKRLKSGFLEKAFLSDGINRISLIWNESARLAGMLEAYKNPATIRKVTAPTVKKAETTTATATQPKPEPKNPPAPKKTK